mmetsp:Transcript_28929/g.55400  ORF Transcript_28929/g.55400 Transcript_28929/m.55400 type:complete len:107 (+) Transcript_28929:279-599(+)|eukprot:CAMPEP_0114226940 /NCGR_PEP_ID=MMETSP0058-20121206/1514_1 /TAXON_ID=36894 /ORGANISM="Pyramimonas parkeae, CCMP726" /LENGTH=106 /DNA_ID=CAMNT_0001337727 /DNA_START=207 /DNA_END=527 /DNA_ORIENTATION=-
MPGFVRSDVRAQLVQQGKETLQFMQAGGDPITLLKTGGQADAIPVTWGERAFVYVFALFGLLFFWVMHKHSAKLGEARRKVIREVAALQELTVDEDNWLTCMPSSI